MYEIPLVYTFLHIATGTFAAKYPYTILLFLPYQFLQYFLNVRFFLLNKDKIQPGNNLMHTLRKLSEYSFGYVVIKTYLYMEQNLEN